VFRVSLPVVEAGLPHGREPVDGDHGEEGDSRHGVSAYYCEKHQMESPPMLLKRGGPV
jgi:hypothetical protein